MTSLRRRLLLGAVLWTLGLVGLSIVTAGLNRAIFETFRRVHQHHLAIILFGVICMFGGLLGVQSALSTLERLRRRLAELREGRAERLDGAYPSEVQPLVDDLNLLLSHTQHAVARANAKAGDLAHGLKTPLAVLATEAERLSTAGQAELAATISEQVARMRRHVDYHLAQARAAASGATPGARCAVSESAEALVRTLRRLYEDRSLAMDIHVDRNHAVRCQREDLDEMLGNLLDNACKWATSRVSVSSAANGEAVAIGVEDDGRGIEPTLREAVLQRGVRADEAAPGSGLGLAIVRDLADLYGGSIALDLSPLGGLRATLRLPRA